MAEYVRSWTDLLSNVTHMGGVRLADHLDDFLRPGGAPPDLMMTCFHEFTHHWCFHSSVGLAVIGLTCRVARGTLASDDGRVGRVLRDMELHRAVTATLRPLSEGLALFAEFDVNTLKSRVLSTPLGSTIALFSGRAPSIQTLSDSEDALVPASGETADLLVLSLPVAVKLREARVSDIGVRRKVNVLALSTRVDADGYAVGYLGVKGMWRTLQHQVRRLSTETDLALAYMKGFFYEDRVLIDILLREASITSTSGLDDDQLSNKVIHRVYERTAQLSDVTADDIDTFEALMLHGAPNGSPEWASCLHLSADQWARGESLYDELKAGFMADPVANQTDETLDEKLSRELHDAFSVMVTRRHIVHLGSQTARVRVYDEGHFAVFIDKREILTGKALPGVPIQSGEGTVELLFSTQSSMMRRAIAVWGAESVVGVVIPGGAPDETGELDLITQGLYPVTYFLRLGEATDRVINSFAEQEGILPVLEAVQSGLGNAVKCLYLDIALNTVSDEDIDDVVQALDDGGVYGMLNHDRDLLEALVIAGAVAMSAPVYPVVTHGLSTHGITDPDGVLSELVKCGASAGFPLVKSDGTYVFVYV